MPIRIQWANEEQTIIYLESTGHWTWDEYVAGDDELRTMLDSVDHPVVILSDTRGVKIPADIFSHFQHLRNGTVLVHPNSAVNVVVVSNRFLLNMLESFLRFYKVDQPRHIMVGTREEAETIVTTHAALHAHPW